MHTVLNTTKTTFFSSVHVVLWKKLLFNVLLYTEKQVDLIEYL